MNTVSTYRGVIIGYRRGSNIQYLNQVYVIVDVDSKSVHGLVGCRVRAMDARGNTYTGKVVKVIGSRNSKLVVCFKRGIPGQLVGGRVVIEKRVKQLNN